MKYILIHKNDFSKEYEKESDSNGVVVGDYHIIRFDSYVPLYLDSYKRFEKNEIPVLIENIKENKKVVTKKVEIETDKYNRQIIAIDKPEGNFDTLSSNNLTKVGVGDWKLEPPEGKVWSLGRAEIQYTSDLSMANKKVHLVYYAWIIHEGVQIAVPAANISFNDIFDLYNYGNKHYTVKPVCADYPDLSLTTVVFDYATKLKFYGSFMEFELAYLEVQVRDNDENPTNLTGTRCWASFPVMESTE